MKKILDKKTIIDKLEQKKIKYFRDVPKELLNDKDIIAVQRKLGHRVSDFRGYDVINDEFFVEERVVRERRGRATDYDNRTELFKTFDEYFNYLDGDIYDNACYFKYTFTDEQIDTYKIDASKLNFSYETDFTIDDIKPNIEEKRQEYFEIKKGHRKIKNWIAKFNGARTYDDFMKVVKAYEKSNESMYNLRFYIWNYVSKHKEDSLNVIVEYLNNKSFCDLNIIYGLCFMFGTDEIASRFKYAGMAKTTNTRKNRQFKEFIVNFATKEIVKRRMASFSASTGYYYIDTRYYFKKHIYGREELFPVSTIYNYFETFEELAEQVNYDFSDCDFTDAFELPVEKILKYNENTRLPITDISQLDKTVIKEYDITNKEFVVEVSYHTKTGFIYFSKIERFKYFFKFLAFLKGDLENAELTFCDGLENIKDFSDINIENARVTSLIRNKAQVGGGTPIPRLETKDYEEIKDNEIKTALILQDNRGEIEKIENESDERKIYYVTDLHLEHRLSYANCKTEEDCIYTIQRVIDDLLTGVDCKAEEEELLLIGGDTASSFWLFEMFIKRLNLSIRKRGLSVTVILTLGNHELWEFSNNSIDEIVDKYRTLIKENGMYLLHNEMLCVFDEGVKSLPVETKETELKEARAILFGGIGFSGCNEEFNATKGIYRNTVSRSTEIEESNKIKGLYNDLCKSLPKENIIVLTHTPFEDWYGNEQRHENYIYVSGHNHRNAFFDDGLIRVYADNQIGYSKVVPRLKHFCLSSEYDLFEDYSDGIYEITKEEYCSFYRGKNLYCNCNSVNQLFMLKKNGYYCFINKNKSGDLTIMNKGSKNALKEKDINYFYQNMDKVIATLKGPYDIYYKAQMQISNIIKKIGGTGKIHGAIIDIDYFNHIYLNPFDSTATPYYATSIIYKRVYPTLGGLLQEKCPELYGKYELLLGASEDNLALKNNTGMISAPKLYLSTDIYSASRLLKKMQNINANILTIWSNDYLQGSNQKETIKKISKK